MTRFDRVKKFVLTPNFITMSRIVAASWLGKYKTGFQIAAIIPLAIHYSYMGINFNGIGLFFLYGALIFTIWSGFDYFMKARKFLSL